MLGQTARTEPRIEFCEPAPCPVLYVDGVAYMEMVNGNIHLAYYVSQPSALGGMENIIQHRLCFPAEGVIEALPRLFALLGKTAMQRVLETPLTRLLS